MNVDISAVVSRFLDTPFNQNLQILSSCSLVGLLYKNNVQVLN